jgi:hypothetical protein
VPDRRSRSRPGAATRSGRCSVESTTFASGAETRFHSTASIMVPAMVHLPRADATARGELAAPSADSRREFGESQVRRPAATDTCFGPDALLLRSPFAGVSGREALAPAGCPEGQPGERRAVLRNHWLSGTAPPIRALPDARASPAKLRRQTKGTSSQTRVRCGHLGGSVGAPGPCYPYLGFGGPHGGPLRRSAGRSKTLATTMVGTEDQRRQCCV